MDVDRSSNRHRIVWVDYYKSFAIFLVVLLHSGGYYVVNNTINAFIIPAFLFMSGYLFSYRRHPFYRPFVYKRFRQLVVPYLWIGAIAYLLWVMVLRHYGSGHDNTMTWYTPVIGTLGGFPSLIVQDIPLWSLLAFFMVELLYYPMRRYIGSDWLSIAVPLIVSVLMLLTIPDRLSWLPFCLGPAICGMSFYAFGQWCANHGDWLRFLFRINLPLLILAIAALAVCVIYNNPVSFFICRVGQLPLFFLGAIAGIVMTVQISLITAYLLKQHKLITFISKATLPVCGFHILMFSLIKGVAYFGFGIAPDIFYSSLPCGFLLAVIAFGLSLLASWMIFRYFDFLIDKK